MALKSFNVQGGLSVGNKEVFDANANLNLTTTSNVALGPAANVHITGGNANAASLGVVSLNGSGNVTAIAISTRGDGYTIAPAITISGANSVPANATVSLFANGAINTITINNAGTGYDSGTVTATIAAPSGRYLQTDGAGNLSWTEVVGTGGGGGGSGEPGGSNTYIQYNDNGAFQGTDGFTFNETSNAVTANGTITGTNFVGANLLNGNSEVAIAANGNITLTATSNATMTITDTGANITGTANVTNDILAGGNVNVTSNINGATFQNGNSNVGITANGNITLTAASNSTMVITGSGANITGTLDVTANANVGNLGTTTAIITTGNITTVNTGLVQNGNSNVAIAANGRVGIGSNGQANILFVTSNGTFAQSTFQNDVTITGNLTVSGNAIYANTEVLTIEDPIIELGTGANGAILTTNDGKDRGIVLHTYGNGAAYTTSGSTPSGNTTIVLASTTGIVAGQIVTIASNPNAIPVGTTVSTVNAGNIVVDTATTAIIADASTLQIGNDILRFMGWSNANGEFQFYSNATVTNEVVSGTLGNVNANTFIGAVVGNLVNGNSNIRIAANANITISANGNANIFTVTSSGDGNLATTGVNVAGYINATGNLFAPAIVQNASTFDTRIALGSSTGIIEINSNGNGTQFTPSGVINLSGASQIKGGTFSGSYLTLGASQTDLVQDRGGNVTVQVGSGGSIANTWTFAQDGSFTSPGNINAGRLQNGNSNVTITANGNVNISAIGNANVVVVTGTGANITGTANVSGNLTAANLIGPLANGNSNVNIPAANGNVNITAVGNTVLVVTGTGANITGTANVSGNANVGNLGTDTAIITTGNITTVNTGLVQNGNSNIAITANANVTITANGSAVIALTSTGDGNPQTSGANITGYVNATGNATASNVIVKAAGSLTFTTGNSNVSSTTLTTTTATANQPLAVISAADGRAVEFIVKGVDSTGLKYSAATILALIGNAANADCDFTTFAQLNTGLSTGDITVALTDSNANITLQVSPSSTNSTVWTTQYRVI